MRNTMCFRLISGAALIVILHFLAGCITSPSVPDIPAVLPDWPEKIPLRVKLVLGELEPRTEFIANTYSKHWYRLRKPVSVGQALAETIRNGLPRIFDKVEEELEQTLPDGEFDLMLKPSYRLMGYQPYGGTRQLSAIVEIQAVDPSGSTEVISTGTVNGEGKGLWRSWRFYVTLPIAPLALGLWEYDQWSQALADLGEQVLKKLNVAFRSSPIVHETVKGRYGEFAMGSESPPQNIPALLNQLCYDLLNLPGGYPPQRLVIAPVYNQDGLRTHWERVIEERINSFFRRWNRDLLEPRNIQETIAERASPGNQPSLLEFIERVRVHSNADAVVALTVSHQDDKIFVRARLHSAFSGNLLSTADGQIEKSWRTSPTDSDR